MTIFDVVRNAVLAGFGARERVKEFVDELVTKGELSESQGAKLVKEWSEKVDKGTSDWSRNISDMITKTMEKMNIPTRDDIEKLNKKIHTLSARVKKLEGAHETEETEQ
ncbi:MAG: hypothetical protein IT388_01780 [Nitrospirales bacterium]|nr:hypothetical protein [Nitrospirales bacterium]